MPYLSATPAAAACGRPSWWCTHAGSTLRSYDCDKDGTTDWVCTDDTGRRGIIRSTNGCQSSDAGTGWPSVAISLCPALLSCSDYDGFVTVPFVDHSGDDLPITAPMSNGAVDVAATFAICSAEPTCAGFNSNGAFKAFGINTTTSDTTSGPSCLYVKTPTICPDIDGFNVIPDMDSDQPPTMTRTEVYGSLGAAASCAVRSSCAGFASTGDLWGGTANRVAPGVCFYEKVQGVPSPPPRPPPPLPPGVAVVAKQMSADFTNVNLTLSGDTSNTDAVVEFLVAFKTSLSKTYGIPYENIVIRAVTIDGQVIPVAARRRRLGQQLNTAATDGAAAATDANASPPLRVWTQRELRWELPTVVGVTAMRLHSRRAAMDSDMARLRDEEQRLIRSLYAAGSAMTRQQLASAHRRGLAAAGGLSLDFAVFEEVAVPLPPSPPPSAAIATAAAIAAAPQSVTTTAVASSPAAAAHSSHVPAAAASITAAPITTIAVTAAAPALAPARAFLGRLRL
ncbi:hypothetical protein GPECTOR_5g185 [Gonium pectorale]|uniref:Uncharacterized protein n=1 Tax=Gonium pectorale TaxID=33097 RepID=A0A150GWA5_GONPE|nr:hypothetical protein GPECTOR_5g185 [Gonium pectorale]|eukprot:KXZ54079.1 hypothetical protein GPECTOR_5g185 [Gonium pectorale]